MPTKFTHWSKRANFPAGACAPLGFGTEYWKSDPGLYEGFAQLQDRLRALGRKPKRYDVVYGLTGNLLNDVLIAAGGVENSILRLRSAVGDLKTFVSMHGLLAMEGTPTGISHLAAVSAWYAFSDVLTWSRTVVERMQRGNQQGLVPALKAKRLRTRCVKLFAQLNDGPVGKSRYLANFILHTALVRHPQTGAQLEPSGEVTLPVPDLPIQRVSHWYLVTWTAEQDGIALAEEIWQSVQTFVDGLLEAFERSVPKRLRRPV